jgi:single-strand DNA-binding protein
MSHFTINRVVLLGNLTRDPELKSTTSGYSVCSVRLAVNKRVKDRNTDEWRDQPNFFDVTIWGKIGENVVRQCSKGSMLLVEGELRWREWQAQDGSKRQGVDVVADKAIPLARAPQREHGDVPQETRRPDDPGGPWTGPGIDDDIPF